MKLPYRILVLDDDANALSGMVEILRDAQYTVTGAATYDAAKGLLAIESYDLLITDVRLRGYNGLNLARQSSSDHPDMGIVIITGYDEPMMEIEAARYHAEFIHKPFHPDVFVKRVAQCLEGLRRQRRWTRKRIDGGFRVVANGQPAAVVDVSYGGLQLEMPKADDVPASFEVEVSGIGLQLRVDTVWARLSRAGDKTICGAALPNDASQASRTWRAIVDRLSA
ncbi:MAG: response regulator [Acidobacteriota bacterium]|nr:response regulator [Acidobacteriota bacterium]MDQ3418133.1 response regulator [Acidobacteriota bacterium]